MKMYKSLIKRKLAYLIQTREGSAINSPAIPQAWQRFDENKEKEIIVWIRQQGDLDKSKIIENISDKFNISDDEASRLYYEAYPDGLSSQEEEIIDYFENVLPKNQSKLVDDAFLFITEDPVKTNISFNADDGEGLYLFLKFLEKMCTDRKLI